MKVFRDGNCIVFEHKGVEIYDPRLDQFEQKWFYDSLKRKTWYTEQVDKQTRRILSSVGINLPA